MKTFVCLLLIISNFAQADCDWKQIKDNKDGTFTYDKELHLCVGSLVKENKQLKEDADKLNKALDLKDLALTKSETRISLWQDTSEKLETRVNKIDEMQSKNQWLFFGFGVLVTGAAVFGASQLRR